MDDVKFIEERSRMCKFYGDCIDCPGNIETDEYTFCCEFGKGSWISAKEQVAIVEKWSKEHPRKTRQSVFLEQYPNASLDGDGILQVSPCSVDKRLVENGCCTRGPCSVCARNYWGQEVE